MPHIFEISGLGKAPFNVIAPRPEAKEGVFWCEHCGTALTHRYYIKSDDGIISIIGIDCLKKTGDIGLIDGAKRLIKKIRNEQRVAMMEAKSKEAEETQRAKNNGLTYAEMAADLEAKMVEQHHEYVARIYDHPVLQALKGSDFGNGMIQIAHNAGDYSPRMLDVIADIIAKQRSGARKGSKAYLASLDVAKSQINELCSLIASHRDAMSKLKTRCIELRNGIAV